MAVTLNSVPKGFEGPNAIRKLFALVAKLNPEKILLNASIGIPGVPSRKNELYPSVELPGYTQTPGGADIQGEVANYYNNIIPSIGAKKDDTMVTPGKIGAFSHFVRSTIEQDSQSMVYIDPECNNYEIYKEIVERRGGVVASNLDDQNIVAIACDDSKNSAEFLNKLRQNSNSLIFADGVFGDAGIISANSDLKDRIIIHRYAPDCAVNEKTYFPDLGMIYTSAEAVRGDNGETQKIIQRLCSAQEHAQTCLPDVCIKDLKDILSAPSENLVIKTSEHLPGSGNFAGKDETLSLVAEVFNESKYSKGATQDNVMLSYGGTGVLFNFVNATIPTSGKIGIFDPYFAAYDGPLAEKNITKINMGLTTAGRPDLEKFAKEVGKLDAVLINNPCNPSGLVWSETELESAIDILANSENKQTKIFLDDTYRSLVFDNEGNRTEPKPFMNVLEKKIKQAEGDSEKYKLLKKRCVVQISASKEIGGDPAKRAGMAYIPDELTYELMRNEQRISVGDIPHHIDCYVNAILKQMSLDVANNNNDDPWNDKSSRTYAKGASIATELAKDHEGVKIFDLVANPNGGFFVMVKLTPDFRDKFYGKKIPDNFHSGVLANQADLPEGFKGKIIKSDVDIAEFLALSVGVVLVPGSGFGFDDKSGVFRVSFSRFNENFNAKEVIGAIKNSIEQLESCRKSPQTIEFTKLAESPKKEVGVSLNL